MNFEAFYSRFLTTAFTFLNPFKSLFIHTECKVHLFNNYQALRLLKHFNYPKAYSLYQKNIDYLNAGSVWADQNFKSSNHFYNPETKRGLFGRSHALALVKDYYRLALSAYSNDHSVALFYLGACIHIIQDLTIPQHINVRLLNQHRQFESFVKYTYDLIEAYKSDMPPILLKKIEQYVEYNSRIALRLDKAYGRLLPLKLRFF